MGQETSIYETSVPMDDQKIIFPQTVGEALTLLQKRARVTTKDLSEQSDLSYASLGDILNDVRSPKLEDLLKIVEVLSVVLDKPSTEIVSELAEIGRTQIQESIDLQAEAG